MQLCILRVNNHSESNALILFKTSSSAICTETLCYNLFKPVPILTIYKSTHTLTISSAKILLFPFDVLRHSLQNSIITCLEGTNLIHPFAHSKTKKLEIIHKFEFVFIDRKRIELYLDFDRKQPKRDGSIKYGKSLYRCECTETA